MEINLQKNNPNNSINGLLKKAGDPEYFYEKQTQTLIDPRSQSEDLENEAIKASKYGIDNLKRFAKHRKVDLRRR